MLCFVSHYIWFDETWKQQKNLLFLSRLGFRVMNWYTFYKLDAPCTDMCIVYSVQNVAKRYKERENKEKKMGRKKRHYQLNLIRWNLCRRRPSERYSLTMLIK